MTYIILLCFLLAELQLLALTINCTSILSLLIREQRREKGKRRKKREKLHLTFI